MEDTVSRSFGAGLRRVRRHCTVTQQGLARLACVSRATICKIESGRATAIYLGTALQLAEALGTTIEALCSSSEM